MFSFSESMHVIEGPCGSLFVQTYGDASRPAVILNHGAYHSSMHWRKIVETLAQSWYVLVWDLPGHGLSAPFASRNSMMMFPAERAASFETIRQYFKLYERGYVVVAWSLGGLVDRDHAHTYGVEGKKGIVLIGSSLEFSDQTLANDPILAPFTQNVMYPCLSADLATRIEAVTGPFFQSLRAQPYTMRSEYDMDNGVLYDSSFRTQLIMEPSLVTQEEILRNARGIPVLAICGKQDVLWPPHLVEQECELFASVTSYEVHIYEACGHAVALDQPKRLCDDVDAFLQHVYHLFRGFK